MLPENGMADVGEVAAHFKTTPQAIHQQRHRGQKPGAFGILIGKRVLFDPAVIRAWIEERQREAVGVE